MTEAQVIALINQWIIANGNNEITADVLRPILLAMVGQPNDVTGDLSDLSTGANTNLVAAINWLNTQISDITGNYITLHQGNDDPNVTPPSTFSQGDFYLERLLDNTPIQLWQYNIDGWKLVVAGAGDQDNQLIPYKITILKESSGSMAQKVAVQINSFPSFTISEKQIPLFYVRELESDSDSTVVSTSVWGLSYKGKGTYGFGGTIISSGDLLNISPPVAPSQSTVPPDAVRITISGSGDPEDILNAQNPPIFINAASDTPTIITTDDGVYWWLGSEGTYGVGGDTAVAGDFQLLPDEVVMDLQTVTENGNTTTELVGVGTETISGTVRAMQVGDGVSDDTNNVLMVTKQITTNANTNALNVRLNVIANANASARVARAFKCKSYLDPNGFTLSNTGGASMGVEGVAYATGSNGGTIDVLTALYSRVINESTNVNCGYLIGLYVNTNNGPALRSIGIMILDLSTQNADSDFYTHLLMGVDNHLYTPAGNYMIYSPKDWPSYMRGKLGINVTVPTEAIDVDGNIKATGNVIISTAPTTGAHATNKTYVDGLIATKANDSDVVKLTGAQSVAGEKTFTNDIIAAVIKNSIPTRGAISMGDISNPGANTRNTTGSMAGWSTTNANSGSTGDIHVFRSNVGGTIADRAGIRKDGRVYGTDGSSSNDFATLAQVPRQLKDFYTDVSNVGTTETDLYSYTIPANTLSAVGQKLVFKHSGISNIAGPTKSIWRVRIAGTAVSETVDGGVGIPLILNGVYRSVSEVIRIDTDSIRVTTDFFFGKLGVAGYTITNYVQVDSLNFASTIVIKSTIQTDGASNDLTAKMGNIVWHPAAP